jgi:hypothetical protein
MSHISTIKKLYEDYSHAEEHRVDSLYALAEIYNIPDDIIAKYVSAEDDATHAWAQYWNSLNTPWWKILWYKLTKRKKVL